MPAQHHLKGLIHPSAPYELWPPSDTHPHSPKDGKPSFLHLPPMPGTGRPMGCALPAAGINYERAALVGRWGPWGNGFPAWSLARGLLSGWTALWGMCIPQAPGLQALPSSPAGLSLDPPSPSAHSLAPSHPVSTPSWDVALASSVASRLLSDPSSPSGSSQRQTEPSNPVREHFSPRCSLVENGKWPGLLILPLSQTLCPPVGLGSFPSDPLCLPMPLTLQSRLRHHPFPASRKVPHTPKTGPRVCWASPPTAFHAGAIC